MRMTKKDGPRIVVGENASSDVESEVVGVDGVVSKVVGVDGEVSICAGAAQMSVVSGVGIVDDDDGGGGGDDIGPVGVP